MKSIKKTIMDSNGAFFKSETYRELLEKHSRAIMAVYRIRFCIFGSIRKVFGKT